MENIVKLKGVVQPYSWGGTDFIPQLLGIENPEKKPFAEYWLGAHPAAPAVLAEDGRTLSQLITEQPEVSLGKAVADRFGSLPYLFKILDVRQMLSIQVHPSKSAAEEEYKKEDERGVPLTAPHRNYKDKNHKPELMVALSDFWLLHGFKPKDELVAVLQREKELSFLLPFFEKGGYKTLYGEVMTMPQEKVDNVLRPLMQRIIPAYKNNELEKNDENFWAARAVLTFCKDKHYDRGIFSVYFFNLLHLQEGEAIYQAAGLPHAYLEGQNVEVMANSDNVLRAGLTDKHVDVLELMKHVKFEATHPAIIRAAGTSEQSFAAPVEEFLLKQYKVNDRVQLTPAEATILFVYKGQGKVFQDEKSTALGRGEALLLLPGAAAWLAPEDEEFVFYTVSANVEKN